MTTEDLYFRQCKLEQGTTKHVAWIAERGAHVGAKVELKDEDESGLWEVTHVGARASREQAISYRDAYRTQRDASDI